MSVMSSLRRGLSKYTEVKTKRINMGRAHKALQEERIRAAEVSTPKQETKVKKAREVAVEATEVKVKRS